MCCLIPLASYLTAILKKFKYHKTCFIEKISIMNNIFIKLNKCSRYTNSLLLNIPFILFFKKYIGLSFVSIKYRHVIILLLFVKGKAFVIILLFASLNSCTNPWIYLAFSDGLMERIRRWKYNSPPASHHIVSGLPLQTTTAGAV